MKTLLIFIITILSTSYSMANNNSSSCKLAVNDLSNCSYENKTLRGNEIKITCESEIKSFLKQYIDNSCHNKITNGFIYRGANFVANYEPQSSQKAIQNIIDNARIKDEHEEEKQKKVLEEQKIAAEREKNKKDFIDIKFQDLFID